MLNGICQLEQIGHPMWVPLDSSLQMPNTDMHSRWHSHYWVRKLSRVLTFRRNFVKTQLGQVNLQWWRALEIKNFLNHQHIALKEINCTQVSYVSEWSSRPCPFELINLLWLFSKQSMQIWSWDILWVQYCCCWYNLGKESCHPHDIVPCWLSERLHHSNKSEFHDWDHWVWLLVNPLGRVHPDWQAMQSQGGLNMRMASTDDTKKIAVKFQNHKITLLNTS